MNAHRQCVLFLGLLGIWLAAGCRGGNPEAVVAETDEEYYRQGQAQVRQDKPEQALASFLKVIVKRGEQPSPESHLEAGVLYLKHSKNPIRAYYHFEEYLAQQGPNSQQAGRVRQLIDQAKKDFALTLPGDPLENQAQRMELREKLAAVQRENDDLHRENAELRNNANAAVLKAVRGPVSGVQPMRINTPAAVPVTTVEEESPITPAPIQTQSRPAIADAPASPGNNAKQTLSSDGRAAPARPGASLPSTMRRHVVAPGEGLYPIARKYYGTANKAKTDAIYEANRDVMKNENDLRPGMELKIPIP
jgi:hypothetical protein